MQPLAEKIITTILAARSISEEEKTAMLDKFSDESVSDETLKAMLDKLCDAEIALRDAENAELQQLRVENNDDLASEEVRIAPEKARIEAEALAAEKVVADEYVQEVKKLDGEFDQTIEQIKRNEHETSEMEKIRTSLGISGAAQEENNLEDRA